MTTPDPLTDRPDLQAGAETSLARQDVLSHLLAWVRLKGEAVYRTRLQGSWHLRFPPGPSHLYFVGEGAFDLRLHDGTLIHLGAGDLALLPHGLGHEITGDRGAAVEPVEAFDTSIFDSTKLLLSNAGIGPTTRLVGGLFRYERNPLPPILKLLPPVIHLKAAVTAIQDWRGGMASFLLDEVDHPAPGSALMISRIIDLMVIRTLRSWSEGQSADAAWLGGAREERLVRALSAMHEGPALPWSVQDLAAIAGMSRSVFAERFTRAFGEPPLRYLMRWRFAIAIELLSDGDLPVSEVAQAVGYESDAGFSRAFKAFYGHAPSSLRNPGDSA